MNLRTINLNGYIDEEMWYGDEITPGSLHEALYGENNANTDDVRIILNSYGGSCNAATRMFDDVRTYPGNVHLIVSGTAASAASVLSLAANRVEMTPGSLFMIHDPSVVAWGNENDLSEAIQLLRACKESILNVYAGKSYRSRAELSDMMRQTTWMDAKQALADGFIDAIADDLPINGPANCAVPHVVDRAEAEKKVAAWLERSRPQRRIAADMCLTAEHSQPQTEQTSTLSESSDASEVTGHTDAPRAPHTDTPEFTPHTEPKPELSGTPVAQLQKRLGLLMPIEKRRKNT